MAWKSLMTDDSHCRRGWTRVFSIHRGNLLGKLFAGLVSLSSPTTNIFGTLRFREVTLFLMVECSKCSIKGLSFRSKDYTKELKIVECSGFLGQTS